MIPAPSASALAPSAPAPVGWVVRRAPAPAGPSVQIWGLSPEERLLRSLRRAGCREPRVVDAQTSPPASGGVVALRADLVVDERLVEALRGAPDTLLVAPDLGLIGAHVASEHAAEAWAALAHADADALRQVRRLTPSELAPAYVPKLRKREPPYVFPARAETAALVEQRTFDASYKGLTDLVTKWVWPSPARAATRWCARHRVRPNVVTVASGVLAIAATILFAGGSFAAGLLCAWAMTFLDTVDGKLARVTLTSSRIGDVMDHGLDLVHPPFWWWAWGIGLGAGHAFPTAVVVIGYLVGRALEGAFLARFGFETHSWRPVDGMFRTITARRNPNLILLSVGAIAGRPDLGLVMVALWTVLSLGFHALRLAQAESARARGRAPSPWEGA
jgi:phosphatidylglycerophosphate synthase